MYVKRAAIGVAWPAPGARAKSRRVLTFWLNPTFTKALAPALEVNWPQIPEGGNVVVAESFSQSGKSLAVRR